MRFYTERKSILFWFIVAFLNILLWLYIDGTPTPEIHFLYLHLNSNFIAITIILAFLTIY